jgi:formylglycine-generating enzyme required for sulfatase activity
LYDMHGNVWEWCVDHWHASYDKAPINGSAWLTDKKDAHRLFRGGGWGSDPVSCRSAFRLINVPSFRSHYLGFRVVCVSV